MIEPVPVFGAVGSETYKPPFATPVPFKLIILSPKFIVVDCTDVVVPFTVKSPLIVMFAPLAVIAALNDCVNEFNDDIDVFADAVNVLSEPDDISNALTLDVTLPPPSPPTEADNAEIEDDTFVILSDNTLPTY